MVVRLFLLVFAVFFVSCQSSPDSKGENIPNQQAIMAGQKAETNVQFLTKQMEEQPSANLYYLRAKNYLALHAYGLADQDMENALRDNPGEPAYLALSARTKQFVEDYTTSIDRAKLTETSVLTNGQNTLLLAQNYLATKQMSLGRFYLKKMDGSLLKNYPMDPYFLRYWARFLVKMKKYDQAALVYKQVLKVFPKTKSFKIELVYFDLAKQGLLPIKSSESLTDSLAVSADSLTQN